MGKILLIDVDGTLVNYENQLPASAVDAIRKARANGHKVYICTGRSKAEVYPNLWEIGLDGMIGDYWKGQSFDLFALKFRLCATPDAYEKTRCHLLDDIRAHGNCLQTGFLGTSVIMDVLTTCARSPEVAYTLLLQRKCPSWLYSVDQGATTVWERWNSYTIEKGFGPMSMNSFNHYAYGCVVEWLFAHAAGIRADPSAPGFRRFLLEPKPDMRLGHLSAT